jgi:hypothetical protein
MDLLVIDANYRWANALKNQEYKHHQPVITLAQGIDWVISELNKGNGKIRKLGFTGHGEPGIQRVGCGESSPTHHDGKSIMYSKKLGFVGGTQLRRLTGHFHEKGVIELHGCNIMGKFKEKTSHNGSELLWLISTLLNVTVRAASGLLSAVSGMDGFDGTEYEIQPGQSKPRVVGYGTNYVYD